ncbi:FtsX-like permease family protein [Olivibacter sitiensis]|uniref:FtsX-like permease family protein n=1 Tax=Olivibacter sitiensis TaxID=376470 RepID=UPI0004082EE8|nr:FtsX-like permease family protein [Olivibacter sitiensis]
MNTAAYIAKRYLFSKKSVNAINVISGISMVGILVSSAALILILSAFNGLEDLILRMYSSFTPELRIEPAKGKVFKVDTTAIEQIRRSPIINTYTEVLQEKVLLRYDDYQYIGLLKGIDPEAGEAMANDSLIWDGRFSLHEDSTDFAVLGAAVYANLGISLKNRLTEIEVFSPRKGVRNAINPADEFIVRSIAPIGALRQSQEFDDLILVPLSFAREMLGEYDDVSAIEINLKPGISVSSEQKKISKLMGPSFIVKNRMQQHPALYKLLNTEKWGVFFILSFVLVIAAFNIVGSLTMLVIDKQKDMAVLNSLGASRPLIRRIFFLEGMMISLIGCLVGLILGLLIGYLQQCYGFVKMGDENMVTDAYPIVFRWPDFILVFLTVVVVSGIASAISSRISVKNVEQLRSAE